MTHPTGGAGTSPTGGAGTGPGRIRRPQPTRPRRIDPAHVTFARGVVNLVRRALSLFAYAGG